MANPLSPCFAELSDRLNREFEDRGLRAAAGISRADGLPDAIFALTDAVAIGMLDGMRTRHRAKAPRDLSIVGFGDTAPPDWAAHRISTIRIRSSR